MYYFIEGIDLEETTNIDIASLYEGQAPSPSYDLPDFYGSASGMQSNIQRPSKNVKCESCYKSIFLECIKWLTLERTFILCFICQIL